MSPELIDALLRGVEGSTVTEVEYQADGHRVRIVRDPRGSTVTTASATSAAGAAPASAPAMPVAQVVCATMHGTFYRSSAPGEPPIVEVGQQVEAGQQLALLEAMKMLHAVESDHAGRIARVHAENASAVEPGTPLFEIEATEGDRV